jgi:F-type H+-transporting ATPase subunit epsilon
MSLTKTLKAEIVTPIAACYSKTVHMIVIPGSKGEFGVLPGHVAMIIGVNPGVVVTYNENMQEMDKIFIAGGFVEVTPESASILAEEAGYLKSYNLKDANERLARLKDDLSFCKNEEEAEIVNKDIQISEALITALK